jgi:chromosome segregation ATPase
MQEVASQLDDQLEETRKTLQASEAQFAALGNSLNQQAQVVDERLLALMNRSVSSGEALAHTGSGLIRLGEELGSTLDQLTLRLAEMDNSAVRNQAQLEMLGVAMRDRVQMLDDASSHMEETQTNLSDGMSLVRNQMEELAASLSDLSQAVSTAREAGLESSMGATLLANEAEALQERMESVTAQLEQRQQHLKALADDTIGRLMVVGEGFTTSVQETDAAQQRLIDRAMEGERVMSGLSEITKDSTVTIERATERLAMLTSQAAADSARVAELSAQFMAQQEGVREAGQAAAMVLQLVEAQVSKASQDGVQQLNTVANKLSDQVAQMLLRLDAISSQSTQTINQLAQAAGQLHEAGSELQQMGSTVGSSLEGNGTRMMQSAIELTTAGQTLDREMRLRLDNVMSSETAITAALGRIGEEMGLLDKALKSCLGRMGSDSSMLVEHLASEIDQIEKLPGKMAEAQEGLMLEISKSRLEMMNLRNELAHSSLQVQGEIQMLDQTSKALLENMEDVRAQSQMTAEQLTLAGVEMAQSTEAAWQTLRETINSGIAGLSGVKDELHGAEDNAKSSIESARRQIEALGQHLSQVADMVAHTSSETQMRYEKMAQLGQGMLVELADRLNNGADRLTQASDVAKLSFAEAVELLSVQERQVQEGGNRMLAQLLDIKGQLASIEDGLTAVDSRMDFVAPSLDSQRNKLEQMLQSVDNTLAQVVMLDERSSALATSHLGLASEMAEQEQKLIALSDLLSSKVASFGQGDAGAFMDKLQQASVQAAEMENRIVQIAHKAVQLDAILGDVSSGLIEDATNFETYEKRLGATAGQVSEQLRQSSNELAETLQRVEKSAKVSHLTLGQTGEETQRMVVRLEQIRALLKTMMGNVSADLTKWQTDLRQQVQEVAQQVKVQRDERPQPQAITRQAQQTHVAQVAAVAQNAQGSVLTNNNSPFFTQLASEALHALAVDLYRLLHTDVAALRVALPESTRGRGPMTPDEARAHTERLVARDGDLLRGSVRELYARSTEFRQFADRYLTRFELQYDVLARSKDNLAEAIRWREGPQGKLYHILTTALERASRLQSAAQPVG